MISQETAQSIWACYREIAAANKLLDDMKEVRKQEYDTKKDDPTLTDVFGRRQHLELGVPAGRDGHRIFRVAPGLAESVIRAHIANQTAELAEANEQARIELDCVNKS